jgi:hypothetical protein
LLIDGCRRHLVGGKWGSSWRLFVESYIFKTGWLKNVVVQKAIALSYNSKTFLPNSDRAN